MFFQPSDMQPRKQVDGEWALVFSRNAAGSPTLQKVRVSLAPACPHARLCVCVCVCECVCGWVCGYAQQQQ